jgi:Plant transposon protein
MFPVKTGIPESPPMKRAAMIESIRKDIETVYGILKRRFRYLKSVPEVKKHESLEAAFVTCCILHNLLLEHDGFLSEDLTNFQNGVKNYLEYTFAGSDLDTDNDFFTTRGVDDTPDFAMDELERHQCTNTKRNLEKGWGTLWKALIAHHNYNLHRN